MSRIVVLVGVLLVMLLVPLYLAKERENRAQDKFKARDAAEREIDARALRLSAASAPRRADRDRFGLTFGWIPTAAADQLHASCRGQPHQLANAHQGACNTYVGDTSCRTVLPVLCLSQANGAAPMALATSPPVAGFMVTSRSDGDARCAQALGAHWRMATYQDTDAGELRAQRPIGIAADTTVRVWAAVKDQPAHCWDPS